MGDLGTKLPRFLNHWVQGLDVTQIVFILKPEPDIYLSCLASCIV